MKLSIIEPGGLNIELAVLFADAGHTVGYYSEFHEAFPTGQRQSIGTGFKDIIRFDNLAHCLKHSDLIICPDTHSQQYIDLAIKYGKPWWGAYTAERLEQDRLYCKLMLDILKLPVGDYNHGTGLEQLSQQLQKHDNLFVKFNGKFRGIGETKHHYDWDKTKHEWWGQLMQDIGPDQESIEWIVEWPIEHIMEVAADQLVINGNFALPVLVGIEDKDSAYIGQIFDKVPEPLQPINEKLTPYLKSCHAKTFISLESMIGKDKKVYLTDPCLRTGHPVSAVQLGIYGGLKNYIIDMISDTGTKPRSKYGIALEIKTTELDSSYLEIQFDPKRRKNVHLQCARQVDDKYYVIPKSFIAATIVGLGDTITEAEKQIHDTLESFSCGGMYYNLNSIDKIKDIMKKGKDVGILFEVK